MIRIFSKIARLLTRSRKKPHGGVVMIPRQVHGISRRHISENALKVLYRLHQQGYQAYLVGGGVRDLLLGLHPKDFDVVTNAKPEDVRHIFRNCRLIGRRFRLAHVYFGYDIIEVATFRGKVSQEDAAHVRSEQGMILRDNVYGTIEEDVCRRDFTINALYYNIADFSIVDYVGGMADLQAKRLKMIGDPLERFREDPVRMLRAIRFACKAQCVLSSDIKDAMASLKTLITHVSPARLFEEIIKIFHSGAALEAYTMLKTQGLFEALFPGIDIQSERYPTQAFLQCVFQNTDNRIKEGKSVNPGFVLAALLWYPICVRTDVLCRAGQRRFLAKTQAMEEILSAQIKQTSIPKRITQSMRDIWSFQKRLERRPTRRTIDTMEQPRFRAAYDFLELRVKAGEPLSEAMAGWRSLMDKQTVKKA